MKHCITIVFLLSILPSFGQHFQWELTTYVLQDYIKSNGIKELTISMNKRFMDSTESGKKIKRKFYFDKKGRLVTMTFLYADTITRRKITYAYDDQQRPYYTLKTELLRDSTGQFQVFANGLTAYNKNSRTLKEYLVRPTGDTLRENTILFNEANQIALRESIIFRQKITFHNTYQYSPSGQFTNSVWKVKNLKTADTLKGVQNTICNYDENDQISTYYQFDYYEANDTLFKRQLKKTDQETFELNEVSFMQRQSAIDTVVVYKHENYIISENERGFISQITEIDSFDGFSPHITNIHFDYTFYNNKKAPVKQAKIFNSTFFAPIYNINRFY